MNHVAKLWGKNRERLENRSTLTGSQEQGSIIRQPVVGVAEPLKVAGNGA